MNATAKTKSPAGKTAWILLVLAWIVFLIPIPVASTIVGWTLNLVAFILAIVAMANGGAMKGLLQLLASLIISPIIYLLGFAVYAAILGNGPYNEFKQQAEAARQQMEATRQAAKDAAGKPANANP